MRVALHHLNLLADEPSCIWNIKHQSTCGPVGKREPTISESSQWLIHIPKEYLVMLDGPAVDDLVSRVWASYDELFTFFVAVISSGSNKH